MKVKCGFHVKQFCIVNALLVWCIKHFWVQVLVLVVFCVNCEHKTQFQCDFSMLPVVAHSFGHQWLTSCAHLMWSAKVWQLLVSQIAF